MIKVENFSFSYADKCLYNDISFELEENNHYGFIGTNGSGKSTLLNIIMNPENYMFDGKIILESDKTIGHISQFIDSNLASDMTVFEYIGHLHIKYRENLIKLEHDMATNENLDELLEEYQKQLDAYELIGGEDFYSIIDKELNVANLLHIKDRKLSYLSGGEFKLVQLLKEMILQPDLIIMDEPDAFLDFSNMESLRNIINSYKKALVVITHNRYILNHCFNNILSLEDGKIEQFEGNYIQFGFDMLGRKIEDMELSIADELEIQRNETLVEKLRELATLSDDYKKGNALKSRVKLLERLKNRKQQSPFVDTKMIDMEISSQNKFTNESMVKVEKYSKAYLSSLLEDINFEIKAKEKVAMIGANGIGKTSLLRDINDNKSQSIDINELANIAYLSQTQGETLNENNTVLNEFFDIGFTSQDVIKRYLCRFNFDEWILSRKIASLSGGEKNLIQLAKINYTKPDLLLLDEPTSHLDLYSQLSLEKALKAFDGSVIMVSHDYYMIINTMDYVLMIEDKKIKKLHIDTFKGMIYSNHYDKKYIKLEETKKTLETKIAFALEKENFEEAKLVYERLDLHLKNY